MIGVKDREQHTIFKKFHHDSQPVISLSESRNSALGIRDSVQDVAERPNLAQLSRVMN